MKAKTIYFEGLNLLRFVAAISVVIFHSSQWYHHDFDTPFKMFLHNLPVAVDFFFILSGFLIIYLLLVEKQQTKTISLKNFYVRRFLRIFPLYYFVVLLSFLFFQTDHDTVAWNRFLSFTGNFWMITENHWTLSPLNPLWSISIEEHFYLVIPFLVLIIPVKLLKYLFVLIVFVSFVFRIHTTLTVPDNWMTIYMHTLSQMDSMAIGGLLALAHYKKKIHFDLPGFFSVLLLFGFVILMIFVDSKDYTNLYYASIKKYLFTIPLLFILILFVFNNNKQFDKLKRNKYLNYLGKISFGIYMYNAIVVHVLAQFHFLGSHYFLKFLLDIILTIVVATISYELFEKQFLKLKTRFQTVPNGKTT